MYDGLPAWYDSWKTACCGRWPNCSRCPYDDDYEDENEEFDEDEDLEDDPEDED